MPRSLGAATLAAVAAIAAGCGGDDEDPRRTGPPPPFGFNDNSVRAGQATAEESARLTRRAGGTISRLTLDWRSAEPTPGAFDFRPYDRIYRALRRRGVKPLWIPMFAPRWAWDSGTSCSGDCRFPPSAAADPAWRRLLARIARRYPESAGIEVWNEPNSILFWRPRPDVQRYLRLLASAHRAVKRADPRMPVITGGLANLESDEDGNVGLDRFAEEMGEANVSRYSDALGLHASPSRDDELLEPALEKILRAAELPVWVTEVGASTTGPEGRARFSEEEQALALVDSYRSFARRVDVGAILVHTLIEPPASAASPERGFGIVRPDLSPKPAYCAIAAELGRRSACPHGQR